LLETVFNYVTPGTQLLSTWSIRSVQTRWVCASQLLVVTLSESACAQTAGRRLEVSINRSAIGVSVGLALPFALRGTNLDSSVAVRVYRGAAEVWGNCSLSGEHGLISFESVEDVTSALWGAALDLNLGSCNTAVVPTTASYSLTGPIRFVLAQNFVDACGLSGTP